VALRATTNVGTGAPTAAGNASPSLAGSDFIRLTSPKRQAVITIVGETGMGKSYLPLFYAPEPVYFINLDGRAEDAVKEALDAGRDIHYVAVPNPSSVIQLGDAEAKRVCLEGVDKLLRNMELARKASLNGGKPGTIVLDTGTELSDLVTLAVRGRLDKVKGDYGESKSIITRQMWRFFSLIREGKCHLVVLARPQGIWRNNEPTGKNKARGHDVLSEGPDWVGELRMKPRKPTSDNPQPFEHEIEIIKPGVNADMIGKVFRSSEWGLINPFVWCNVHMYRGSEPGDWI
jgi:hypothetical protein